MLNYQRLIIGLPNDLTRSHFDMRAVTHRVTMPGVDNVYTSDLDSGKVWEA